MKNSAIVVILACLCVIGTSGVLTAGDGALESLNLPEELLDRTYTKYEYQGVSQDEAEVLMISAVAAVYFPDRGELRLLSSDSMQASFEWMDLKAQRNASGSGEDLTPDPFELTKKVDSFRPSTLRAFLSSESSVFDGTEKADGEAFLAKAPVFRPKDSLPARTENPRRAFPTKSEKDYYYLYEDFEGDVWSLWSRSDNTGGQYTWGVRSCDASYSTYSADAPRGGSLGALLDCSSPYPGAVESYMYMESCQSIPDHWVAYLEFELALSVDKDGDDNFVVGFEDSSGGLWGWAFWGTTSDWFRMVFNLRQWVELGDLGDNYCNTLNLGFWSDALNGSGLGAKVDELYVEYGDYTLTNECSIVADPLSGTSPLTVSFRATTDLYDPTFSWSFGDGATSDQRDPAHLYTDSGDFRVKLRVYDDYGIGCYASQSVSVFQGTCTYSVSPGTSSMAANGGNGQLSVTSDSGCAWTASTSSSWIHITSGSIGSGSGTVSYRVDQNSSSNPRTGTISVGSKIVQVNQSGKGGVCTPTSTVMCLNNDRFKVTATYETSKGDSGNAKVVKLTNDTGYLWFFKDTNVEAVVKILNACPLNNNYWVFAGGLTNVEVTLTVEDTSTGQLWTRTNPQGTPFQPIQDVEAFATCN